MKQRHPPITHEMSDTDTGAGTPPSPPCIYGKLAYLSWHRWMTDSLGSLTALTFHLKAESLSISSRIRSHHKLPDRWTHRPYGTYTHSQLYITYISGCYILPFHWLIPYIHLHLLAHKSFTDYFRVNEVVRRALLLFCSHWAELQAGGRVGG